MGLNEFQIQFDNPLKIYHAGQTVSGQIILVLDTPEQIRGAYNLFIKYITRIILHSCVYIFYLFLFFRVFRILCNFIILIFSFFDLVLSLYLKSVSNGIFIMFL